MKQKVIIVGAGPAGLTCAYELLRTGGDYEVTILEETQDIGGISQTILYNGNRMDIGGHRFFSKDPCVMEWWKSLMPLQGADSFDDAALGRTKPLASGGPNPDKEDRVMLVRQRISRIYYRRHFFDYPISMKWQTIRNMGFFTTLRAGLSYLKASVFRKPETNLENFYINRFGKVLYGMFFEGYTEKLWGRHPDEISADWGAQRVKGLSVRALFSNMLSRLFGKSRSKKEVETSLIEEFWYPKYGPGQLWETVADEIVRMGGRILKGHRVKTITVDNGKVTGVVCETQDGPVEFGGDIFVSSMPVKDLVNGMTGNGKPSPEAVAIAKGLPYRDFVTVGLLVPRLNLKNETSIPTFGNIVPDDWIYVQDTGVKLGRIQIFNNWSPYMVKDPEHTVWIGLEYFCEEGDSFWSMSDEQCVRYAAQELEQMGIICADDVMDAHRVRVKKAYPAYFDTYTQMDKLVEQLDRYENLFCIGRNGQHRYNNMDHSMVTAFEAVKAIRTGSCDKSAIWNVNTEKSYHETAASEAS